MSTQVVLVDEESLLKAEAYFELALASVFIADVLYAMAQAYVNKGLLLLFGLSLIVAVILTGFNSARRKVQRTGKLFSCYRYQDEYFLYLRSQAFSAGLSTLLFALLTAYLLNRFGFFQTWFANALLIEHVFSLFACILIGKSVTTLYYMRKGGDEPIE